MIKGLTLIAQGGLALGIFSAEQQQIISWIIDDILTISMTFAVVNLAIFFPAVFRGLHRKIAATRAKIELDTLVRFSLESVRAAQTAISGHNPQIKYDFACHAIDAYCKYSGTPIPSDELKRVLIESSLHIMRSHEGWYYVRHPDDSEGKPLDAQAAS